MTRIKLIQFWTCFTGIVLTHPRNMYVWSVFWGVMLMYLPMVVGVFEIIMLRIHTFKDYGQLIFHVFVCVLWQLGFALLAYLWATEDNLTTLGHALFYMNAFLGILFLLEIAIFVHVVRARINFLKRIDNEIDEREQQKAEEEAATTRSSVLLTRSTEFVSRETILEKEKRELIQSIKVRLENEMKIRDSEEIDSGKFRTPRSNEGEIYSEQIPRTPKPAEEEPSTSKTNDKLSVEESTTTKGDDNKIESPHTSKTGGENSTEDPLAETDGKSFLEDKQKSFNQSLKKISKRNV
ncbi:hypothetical protein LSTR_LSTR016774 [Laodelphax striatellus]|uniref:Uncharacterized protein n=1 Tax=Laodelphax striatellus TaxID=195883 RepID=A0A482WYV0_LAOST|nr:hypothetical protein LSTR_LSTR016774 [Laodelphax striatellus]